MRAQCRLLSVSRSGYYYEASPESPENLRLMRRIDELHLRHPVYGSPRQTAELRREGWDINPKYGSCGQDCCPGVTIVPLPPRLLPQSKLGIGLPAMTTSQVPDLLPSRWKSPRQQG